MGTFYTRCKFENPVDRTRSVVVSKLLVDTGSEFTWIPARTLEKVGIQREKKDVAFVLANGQQVTRSVGFAIIRLDRRSPSTRWSSPSQGICSSSEPARWRVST